MLCVIFLGLSGLAWGQSQIGFVDMNQIIQQSSSGAAAMKNLAAFKEQKNKNLPAKEKKIQELKDQITQRLSLNAKDPGLAKVQKDYQDAVQEYNKLQTQNQAEINKKDRELTQGIIEDVHAICSTIKQERGFAYIFDKSQSGVMIFPPENEITREVIKRYDEKYKTKTK